MPPHSFHLDKERERERMKVNYGKYSLLAISQVKKKKHSEGQVNF